MMGGHRRCGDGVLLLVGGDGAAGRHHHLMLLLMMFTHGRRQLVAAAAVHLRACAVGKRRRRLRRLLLGLHAPVLEPDFDLTLRQAQSVSDLDAPASRQVPVELELFLQLERLVASVRLARPLRHRKTICKTERKEIRF